MYGCVCVCVCVCVHVYVSSQLYASLIISGWAYLIACWAGCWLLARLDTAHRLLVSAAPSPGTPLDTESSYSTSNNTTKATDTTIAPLPIIPPGQQGMDGDANGVVGGVGAAKAGGDAYVTVARSGAAAGAAAGGRGSPASAWGPRAAAAGATDVETGRVGGVGNGLVYSPISSPPGNANANNVGARRVGEGVRGGSGLERFRSFNNPTFAEGPGAGLPPLPDTLPSYYPATANGSGASPYQPPTRQR